MVTLGIVIRRYGNIPPRYLFYSRFGKLVLLFCFLLLLSSSRDSYLYHYIISHIPNLFMSLFIGYIVIRNEKDLELLVKIFVWQAAFIGLFILVEYYGNFSIGKTLASTNPNFIFEQIRDKNFNPIFRSGFYRVSGLDNNSVNTGYRLAFLFPLVLWYSIQNKNTTIKYIPLALVIAGLFFLQTRAAVVSVAVSLVLLGLFLVSNQKMGIGFKFGRLSRIFFLLILLSLTLLLVSPGFRGVVNEFVGRTMVLSATGGDVSVVNKLNRLPIAIKYFLSNPLMGYGSPQAVYYNLMATEDIPGVLVYFLSGGVLLGCLYIYMHLYLPYILLKISKNNGVDNSTKLLLIFLSCAYIAGFVCVFSNFVETHFWIMYSMFGAIYKTYYLRFNYKNKLAVANTSKILTNNY